MRFVNIAGIDFEVAEDRRRFMKTAEHAFHLPIDSNDRNAIKECYGKPSTYKVTIWNEWVDWASKNGANLWITSHNCMRFSISGRILVNGVWWNLYITAEHNRATPVHSV